MTGQPARVRRVVTIRAYWIPLVLITVALAPLFGAWVAIEKADENARELVARYERDRAATAEANRGLYCVLFGSQMDAFADSQTPVGRASYEAWLAVYRLARCQPPRK